MSAVLSPKILSASEKTNQFSLVNVVFKRYISIYMKDLIIQKEREREILCALIPLPKWLNGGDCARLKLGSHWVQRPQQVGLLLPHSLYQRAGS